MPELISKWFWLFFAAMAFVNTGVLWTRSRRDIALHPERSESYSRLLRGYAIGFSLPWLLAGGILLAHEADGLLDFLQPIQASLAVQLWHAALIGLVGAFCYWLFAAGGAEQLASHPALMNRTCSTAESLKLWMALALVGAICGEIAMWSGWLSFTSIPK